MSVDPERFKQALAGWASGVTIVTSRDAERVQGMTVSAFSSASLDPPLVLICADKASNTLRVIQASGAFTVSVLAEGQHELSERFANKALEDLRFEGLVCASGATGCPRIPGAASYLDCHVVQDVDAGDHVVFLGRVEAVETSDRSPLLYLHGRYRGLR